MYVSKTERWRAWGRNSGDQAVTRHRTSKAESGLQRFNLRQRHRAQQAGIVQGPIGGIEGAVVEIDEIDVVEDLPGDFPAVEVADAVGRDVRDFDLQQVALRLELVDRRGKAGRSACRSRGR